MYKNFRSHRSQTEFCTVLPTLFCSQSVTCRKCFGAHFAKEAVEACVFCSQRLERRTCLWCRFRNRSRKVRVRGGLPRWSMMAGPKGGCISVWWCFARCGFRWCGFTDPAVGSGPPTGRAALREEGPHGLRPKHSFQSEWSGRYILAGRNTRGKRRLNRTNTLGGTARGQARGRHRVPYPRALEGFLWPLRAVLNRHRPPRAGMERCTGDRRNVHRRPCTFRGPC